MNNIPIVLYIFWKRRQNWTRKLKWFLLVKLIFQKIDFFLKEVALTRMKNFKVFFSKKVFFTIVDLGKSKHSESFGPPFQKQNFFPRNPSGVLWGPLGVPRRLVRWASLLNRFSRSRYPSPPIFMLSPWKAALTKILMLRPPTNRVLHVLKTSTKGKKCCVMLW